ncbi:gamma-glutamylcyclotransferase [Luteolibacter sp. Populi]|uniref:gamma-glutamylcyclotransferase family protein n=1 Tax=Luteolibacter sp. Populi TaxID=3230487 RepID=UPI00346643BF
MLPGNDGTEFVFVYGALRRGASDAYRMAETEWVGATSAQGSLFNIASRPALIFDHDSGWWTPGEVYQVSPAQLEALDEYHGLSAGTLSGRYYRRVRRSLPSPAALSQRLETWVWEWVGPMEGRVRIRSRDWMDVEFPRRDPWLTLTALGCLLSPAALLLLMLLTRDGNLVDALALLALASPAAGCFANYLAGRRRERWTGFRIVLWILLILEWIPVSMVLFSLARMMADRFF